MIFKAALLLATLVIIQALSLGWSAPVLGVGAAPLIDVSKEPGISSARLPPVDATIAHGSDALVPKSAASTAAADDPRNAIGLEQRDHRGLLNSVCELFGMCQPGAR